MRSKVTRFILPLLAVSLYVSIAILHVSRTAGYRVVSPLLPLLPWALTANVAATILTSSFTWRLGWKCSKIVAYGEILLAFIPLFLMRSFRIPEFERRMMFVGFVWALFVFAKAAVLIYVALANSDCASERESPHRVWVFVTSLLVYAMITPWAALSFSATGDEPHYLLLAHSLVVDHDFDLANNYQQQNYRDFYPSGLDHHTVRGVNGEEFLFHDVGLSLLLTPGFALARRIGALLELNIVAAFAALGIYELALNLYPSRARALMVWALFSFSCPVIGYSSQIYPEIVGATIAIWAVIAFAAFYERGQLRGLWWAGLLLSILPWMIIRFWMLTAPMLLVFVSLIVIAGRSISWGKRVGQIILLSSPLALSVLVFAVADLKWFGTPLPNAGYHMLVKQFPQFSMRVDIGLLGGLFDRGVGLVPYCPIYLLALAGAVAGLRHRHWVVGATLLPAFTYILFVSFSRSWGGGGLVGRYLLAGISLLAPFAMFVITKIPSLTLAAGVWSAIVAVLYTAQPGLRYPFIADLTTSQLWIAVHRSLGIELGILFPSMVRRGPTDYVMGVLWMFATILFGLMKRRHGLEVSCVGQIGPAKD